MSTLCGAQPLSEVQQWDKKAKITKAVSCPNVVSPYNKSMGGVDVLDQLIEYYRTYIKTKKWTLKVILHFMDAAIVNSWQQYRNDCRAAKISKSKTKDLLHFRLQLAEALISRLVDQTNDLVKKKVMLTQVMRRMSRKAGTGERQCQETINVEMDITTGH